MTLLPFSSDHFLLFSAPQFSRHSSFSRIHSVHASACYKKTKPRRVSSPSSSAIQMTGNVAPTAAGAGEFWIFGYGSLIWKPPPHYDRRIPGWVTGYVRRFWQASQDHRGTPEAPGRVATLIERSFWESLTDHHDSASDKVWGVAYRIAAAHAAEVREYLDIREINGYTIHYTPFHPADAAPPFRTMVYIGTPDNDQFTGPQDVQALAEHIYRSTGPSGPNRDYLWGLETALDELSPESGDEHVSDLSARVRAISERQQKHHAAATAAVSVVEESEGDAAGGADAAGQRPSAV